MAAMEERFICMASIYVPRSTSGYGAWVGFFPDPYGMIAAPSFEIERL
jgi:hypothetical protein